jgi:hypothetical protein
MTLYVRRNNYEAVQLDGEWIILNTDDYTITKLNDVGGFCWSLLHDAQSLHSLIGAVQERYETASDSVEMDMETFLNEMLQCGLLKHANQ